MRYKEPFTLFPRKTKKGKEIWYYRTYDADGNRTTAKSTGQISKTAARTYVTELLRKGNLIPKKDPTFKEYFGDWWTWDKCQYVQLRKADNADGNGISRKYTENCRAFLKNHMLPSLGDKRLSSITVKIIEQWKLSLIEKQTKYKKSMSATSVNHIFRTLKTMFKEAVRIGDLSYDPTGAVRFLKENRKEKSFLTIQEIHQLFDKNIIQKNWNGDLKHYTLSLLAACTGIRLGECQALQNKYVFDGYIQIEYSWARKYKLTNPKGKSKRCVPIPSGTLSCLKELISMSPYQEDDDFIFWGINGKKPVDQKTISEILYEAFEKIGISEKDRIERNISFHSWRHFFNSYFRTKIPDIKLMKLTGHKSEKMADHYTHFSLEDFQDVIEIQEDFFTGENDER